MEPFAVPALAEDDQRSRHRFDDVYAEDGLACGLPIAPESLEERARRVQAPHPAPGLLGPLEDGRHETEHRGKVVGNEPGVCAPFRLDRNITSARLFFWRNDDEVAARRAADLAAVPLPFFPQLEDQRRPVEQWKFVSPSILENYGSYILEDPTQSSFLRKRESRG